jgi:hypothetical protein
MGGTEKGKGISRLRTSVRSVEGGVVLLGVYSLGIYCIT